MSDPTPFPLCITPSESGDRIDRIIAKRGIISRTEAQRWIAAGNLSRRGKTVSASKTLAYEGDQFELLPLPPEPSNAEPEDLPLTICYEDDDLLVVHKEAGMVVHPAPGHRSGTLVNALLHHVSFLDRSGDPLRPGIVHRLDKDTSGVLVVAKTRPAREGLIALFAAHDIERRYDALVRGAFRQKHTFDTLHGRHPRDRKRFSSTVDRGKRAVTHVTPVEQFGKHAALVQCTLETGRTHQIRVHLSDHQSPVLADTTYGPRRWSEVLKPVCDVLKTQALHAAVLGFVHPISGEPIRIEAKPPTEFQRAVELLRTLP